MLHALGLGAVMRHGFKLSARQEARKARGVASPRSQSPIGVVKRNHALNLASRIKNAYLARTKSSAGFRIADCLMMRHRKYKHNGSRQRQMFSGRLILTSFCCRRSGITTPVPASMRRSRQEFIMSQFALHLRSHSIAGLGKQQVAILSKYQAQAAWSESWKSMNVVDPPRGFAFAWFRIGNAEIGVYSVHSKSNLITHGNR